MSLATLLKRNFMTIEELSGTIDETTHGAFEGDWIPIEEFKNMRCHIQEKKRTNRTMRFGAIEEEHTHMIYHNSKSLKDYEPLLKENKQVTLRVITHKDVRKQLSFPVEHANQVDIYELIGHHEQVSGISQKKTFYVIKANLVNHLEL